MIGGIVRLDQPRLLEIRQCALHLTHRLIGAAAIIVGAGVTRVDPQRLGEIRDRAVVVPQLPVEVAAIVVSVRVVRIEFHRPRVVGYRPAKIAAIGVGAATIAVGAGEGGVDPQRGVEVGDGAIGKPRRSIGDAAIVVCVSVVRIEADSLVIVRDRCAVLAGGPERVATIVVNDGALLRRATRQGQLARAGEHLLVMAEESTEIDTTRVELIRRLRQSGRGDQRSGPGEREEAPPHAHQRSTAAI